VIAVDTTSRTWIALGALAAASAFVFWPSLAGIAELWTHPERRTYQHGFLIAAIAIWLLFRARRRIAAAAGRPSLTLLGAAAGGSLLWAVAVSAGLQALHFLLWPAILWAAAGAALGWRAARVMIRPFAFLYFALPIWDALMPGLQQATVIANRALGATFGVPMVIEGTLVHVPAGSFEIAGGCSGLNYLIVGLAVAALFAEINGDSLRRRLLLLVLSGALAILSNWLRVFIIIYAGHVSDMQHYLVRVDHYNFGWVLYAFVLAAFFLIARRLPDSPATRTAEEPMPTTQRRALPIVLALTALAVGPVATRVAAALSDRSAVDTGSVGIQVLDLDESDRWIATPAIGGWVPVFPGADAESLVEFSNDADIVSVYTATYLSQSQGRELIGHASRVQGTRPGRFERLSRRAAVNDPAVPVVEGVWLEFGGGRALLWWSYQVGDRRFARGLPAQLWYGVVSLWKPPVSSVVVLRASCASDCEAAREILGRFAADELPELLAASAQVTD